MIPMILWSFVLGALSVSDALNSSSVISDEFLKNSQKDCFSKHNLISCIKYRTGKVLWKLASNSLGFFPNEENRAWPDARMFRIVQLAEPSDAQIFKDSRSLQDDTEILKTIKFLQRMTELFTQNHGLQIDVSSESGARIISDDTSIFKPRLGEKKKRKWLIILPLIILMKIAHLKMTLVPLLLGTIGLNVLLVGGGGWLIYYLKYKTLCKIHPQLVQSHSHVYDSDPSEYSSFAGSSYPGYSGGHGGASYYSSHEHSPYHKDWISNKAYNAYSAYRTQNE